MLFKRYDRWIEELNEVVSSKRTPLASSREMDLVAISTEILEACRDRRDLERFGFPIWESMASDLENTLNNLGPETQKLINDTTNTLLTTIRQKLLQKKRKQGRRMQKVIVKDNLPLIENNVRKLVILLDTDSALTAAWRDLVAACQNENHKDYSFDRVTFFADNVLALQRHRGHDPDRFGSTTKTAVSLLMDNSFTIKEAQHELGLPVIDVDHKSYSQPSGLTLTERLDLAEKWIVQRPAFSDFIVWLRLDNAFSVDWGGEKLGDITFYRGVPLAFMLTDHDQVREHFIVTPEELLTEEIKEFQTIKPDGSENINEYQGFEHEPEMLYARILIRQVPRHRAEQEARLLLESLLDLLNPHPEMWRLLKGSLVFQIDQGYRPLQSPLLSWGLKRDRETTVLPMNDDISNALKHLRTKKWILDPTTARRLRPIMALSDALDAAESIDSEAVVLAAVRAIEHGNTWVTQGDLHWITFVEKYFQQEFARNAFIERSDITTMSAIHSNSPNLPGHGEDPVQKDIREKVFKHSPGQTFNRMAALREVGRLKEIYKDRPLHRRLSELDDVLASGDAIKGAFLDEQKRVGERISRLNRLRNAATHGGILSKAACDSVETFATALAGLVLSTARRAVLEGEEISDYFEKSRVASERRVELLASTGELNNLFVNLEDKY